MEILATITKDQSTIDLALSFYRAGIISQEELIKITRVEEYTIYGDKYIREEK